MLKRTTLSALSAIVLAILCLAAQIAPAAALTIGEVRALSRDGEPAELEARFDALEAEIAAGERRYYARAGAFNAFNTMDTRVEAFVARWRREFPDSPNARIARAQMLVSIGLIVRGNGAVWETPPPSMEIMHRAFGEALPLVNEALETLPDSTAAADLVEDISRWTGNREAARRADDIYARTVTPDRIFWRQLYDFLPQCGGNREFAAIHCRSEAPEIEGVSSEECLAVLAIQERPRTEDVGAALATLQREAPERHAGLIVETLLDLGRAEEALAWVREVDYWVGARNARRFARLLRDPMLQIEFNQRWLEVNPLQPNNLAGVAEAYKRMGETAMAEAAIE